MIIWFTGQPGSGKTTLAKKIIGKFNHDKVIHIDGDDLRDVLDNKDYSERGRRKNIQFAIDMTKIMESKGYLVVVSLVSPYRDMRIGKVFYLHSKRNLRKEYHVENYEPPTENFTKINTENPIEECIDEILNVCR
jgi:adenylylsulfate kinase-like enzyme